MERLFLGWDRLALPVVLETLRERYSREGQLHLEGCLFVFPGGRAARRFLDLLAEPAAHCESLPQTITIGQLPEALYEPKHPFANTLTQELAWAEGLRGLPSDSLKVLTGQIPDHADLGSWLALGRLLSVQHRELAADRLGFADVVTEAERLGGLTERERWVVLSEVQQRYHSILDSYSLWDKQTARIVALDKHEFSTDRDVVLVGLVDLNRTQREMLDQISDRVTSLVFAPESAADLFDSHGCLIPEMWEELQIDLSRTAIKLVDGPLEQAKMVLDTLAGFAGRYSAGEIVIGMGHDGLAPVLHRALSEAGLSSRSPVEKRVGQSLPSRLLESVAAYLQSGRTREFLALVRHPDVHAWLCELEIPEDWLEQIDREVQECLSVRPEQLPMALASGGRYRKLFDAVELLVSPLRESPRVLTEWRSAIVELLLTIYSHVEFQTDLTADRLSWVGCSALIKALDDQQRVPMLLCPAMTAAEGIRLTLEMSGSETIPPAIDPNAIELLGWLELSLDDAPALLMTSFNEGRVPSSVNADPFLPNRLRKALGIEDNSRRYARDAYTLRALANSREHLSLILARHTEEGDPLVPSRLLFAADDETISRRVREFYDPTATEVLERPEGDESKAQNLLPPEFLTESVSGEGAKLAPTPRSRRKEKGESSSSGQEIGESRTEGEQSKNLDDEPTAELAGFRIARPSAGEQARDSISVTAFRDYLQSPYLYYLKHVRRVQSVDLMAQELTGAAFGTVVHKVLQRFGVGPQRRSANAEEINAELSEILNDVIASRFGSPLPAAMEVQLAQLRRRFKAFATVQAELSQEGWQIEYIEQTQEGPPLRLSLEDGRSMELRGKIDRIDFHPERKCWRIIDYKTSESAKSPESVHRVKQEVNGVKELRWVDLQLPLYVELARPLGVSGEIELAYFQLPKDLDDVKVVLAEWSHNELQEAVGVAKNVIRGILDREFWDTDRLPADKDLYDLSGLLQCGTLDRDETVYHGVTFIDSEEEGE